MRIVWHEPHLLYVALSLLSADPMCIGHTAPMETCLHHKHITQTIGQAVDHQQGAMPRIEITLNGPRSKAGYDF